MPKLQLRDGRRRPLRVQWGLSQPACPSTGAFLNGRRASTAGFRTLQVKPQSREARLWLVQVKIQVKFVVYVNAEGEILHAKAQHIHVDSLVTLAKFLVHWLVWQSSNFPVPSNLRFIARLGRHGEPINKAGKSTPYAVLHTRCSPD